MVVRNISVSSNHDKSSSQRSDRDITSSAASAAHDDEYPALNLRVLIVDDAVLCRKFHKRILCSTCKEVIEAGNGKEAVDLIKDSLESGLPVHGILMDSSMPFMNGTTATKMIRELGYTGKIFGITGNGFQSDIDDFLSHGVDEVLVKPISMEKYAYVVDLIAQSARDGTPSDVIDASTADDRRGDTAADKS